MKPTYKSYNQQTYLYTKGKEFMLGLNEYIGEYHIQQGSAWTGPISTVDSLPLSIYVSNKNIIIYENISNSDIRKKSFLEPYYSFDTPTKNEYKNGSMIRYFVRRRNDPDNSIMEISSKLGKVYGKPGGIDNILYEIVRITWRITNDFNDIGSVMVDNIREILKAKKQMPGVDEYFTSPFEYSYEII